MKINNINGIYKSTVKTSLKNNTCKQKTFLSNTKNISLAMAMTSLAFLNTSCLSDDFKKYNEMRTIKENAFDQFSDIEKNIINSVDIQTFKIKDNIDSLAIDTKDYKINAKVFRGDSSPLMIGNITDKNQNKTIKFINQYNDNGNLENTTLKDKSNDNTFYVQYDKSFIASIKNKNGEDVINSESIYISGLAILLLSLGAVYNFNKKSTK